MRTIGKIVARRATHGKSWANCLISFAFLACISIASVSNAHGIWFAPRVSQLALVYGVGSQDLEIAKRLPQVTSINAYDDAWRPVKTGLLPAGPLLLVDMENQPSAVSAVLDNGYYVKLTEDGEWLKKGRDEEPDAVSAEKTMKFAVHISKPLTSPIPLMPSQRLQIVPIGESWPTTIGDEMKLKIFFDGRPAVGALVKADYVGDVDAEPQISAKDGTVTIRVRNQGLNVISAMHYGPTDNVAKADRIENMATLSFVLAQQAN